MRNAANEYAEALFSLTEEEGLSDAFAKGGVPLILAVAEPAWIRLLSSPDVPLSARTALIDEAFRGQNVHPYLSSLIRLMVTNGRAGLLPDALRAYLRLWRHARHVSEATVETAVPLRREERERLLALLRNKTGGDVLLTERTDPSLIGGMRVTVEGVLYEDTVRSRLDRMRDCLNEITL